MSTQKKPVWINANPGFIYFTHTRRDTNTMSSMIGHPVTFKKALFGPRFGRETTASITIHEIFRYSTQAVLRTKDIKVKRQRDPELRCNYYTIPVTRTLLPAKGIVTVSRNGKYAFQARFITNYFVYKDYFNMREPTYSMAQRYYNDLPNIARVPLLFPEVDTVMWHNYVVYAIVEKIKPLKSNLNDRSECSVALIRELRVYDCSTMDLSDREVHDTVTAAGFFFRSYGGNAGTFTVSDTFALADKVQERLFLSIVRRNVARIQQRWLNKLLRRRRNKDGSLLVVDDPVHGKAYATRHQVDGDCISPACDKPRCFNHHGYLVDYIVSTRTD